MLLHTHCSFVAAIRLQGPYGVVAAGRNSPTVSLWDARRSAAAVAEITTPGRVPLHGPIETSADGLVLYGLAQGNTVSIALPYVCARGRWGGG